MHHRTRGGTPGIPPKVVDIDEDQGLMQFGRRTSALKSVDIKAYEQMIETELKKHFETNPVLRKIRAGDPVSDRDISSLVSLVLTQNPDVERDHLEGFFSGTASPLYLTIRTIVGMDPEAVRQKFEGFVQKHPQLTAKQTRFLSLLQNHIARYGTIKVERLYDAPFTVIDADGPDGVFKNEGDLSDLIQIVRSFGVMPQVHTEGNPNERNL